MARARPREPAKFTPAWLAARLHALVPASRAWPPVVAFSGGADSTALLAALARLRRAGRRCARCTSITSCGRSRARWSAHCRRRARALGVPLKVRRIVVPRPRGISLEAAAREARYAALGAALRPDEVLLTAHHEDDQLETVLLQLLRGAGVAGTRRYARQGPLRARLAGAAAARDPAARSCVAWLRARRLDWVEDDSNADEHLDRNYLRAQVLPALRARWPAAARPWRAPPAIWPRRSACSMRSVRRTPRSAAVGEALSAPVLRRLAPARRRNALRHWITATGFPAPPRAPSGGDRRRAARRAHRHASARRVGRRARAPARRSCCASRPPGRRARRQPRRALSWRWRGSDSWRGPPAAADPAGAIRADRSTWTRCRRC